MKKLSDFKDDAAIEVVADLLPYISEIVQNPANKEARGKDTMSFISALLRNSKHAVVAPLAGSVDRNWNVRGVSFVENCRSPRGERG